MSIRFRDHRVIPVKNKTYQIEFNGDISSDNRYIIFQVFVVFYRKEILSVELKCDPRARYEFSLFEKSKIIHKFHEEKDKTTQYIMHFYETINNHSDSSSYSFEIEKEMYQSDIGYRAFLKVKELDFLARVTIVNDVISFSSADNYIPVLTNELFPMKDNAIRFLIKNSKHRTRIFFYNSIQEFMIKDKYTKN